MCGIVGFMAFAQTAVGQYACPLDESIRILAHRGPDARGRWLHDNVGLGFTRLAIQDLSEKGQQPMFSADGRYVIVFNGEIYNFQMLRQELEQLGHVFTSQTDTEVLLTLYQIEGKACLAKLNGMFAFAIFDALKKSLFLVRDRFGIKPLYALNTRQGFFFASELKAFLPFVRRCNIPWQIDESHLFEYMLFRYIAGGDTLIRNAVAVAPGSWIELNADGSLAKGPFYDLNSLASSLEETSDSRWRDEEGAIAEIKNGLSESIRLQMISDAPIGVALSGGVDSSLITAVMRERYSGDIDTFSVVFEEKATHGRTIDESLYSDYVAHTFETRHHKIHLDAEMFSRLYPTAVWLNDEPMNFPNCMGVYLLSRFASERVKVLLGGEGADEAFAGYGYFASSHRLYPMKGRVARVRDVRQLLNADHGPLRFRGGLIRRNPFSDRVNQQIYYSLHTYLQTIENRLDKMSMGAGVEFRVPYLDHHLVEASLRLPGDMKLKGNITKYILKKLAARYLPKEQIYRPKVGFSTPLNSWIRTDAFRKYVSILKEERTLKRPYYREWGILALLSNFENRPDTFLYSYAGLIWNLLNLEMWIRTFIEEKQPLESSACFNII